MMLGGAMKFLTRFTGLCIGLLFSGMSYATWTHPQFDQLYIFGDSLSDVGNFVSPTPNCEEESAPVTDTSGSAPPYVNGYLWVNYLAQDLGTGPVTSGSLLHPSGNDWAVAGATTNGVVQQVEAYTSTHRADPNALYIVWIGANDIGTIVNNHLNPYVAMMQDGENLATALINLYDDGARYFLIPNVPDLSLTPEAMALPPADRKAIQELTYGWNMGMYANTGVNSPLIQLVMHAGGNNNVTIYTTDIFTLLDEVAMAPQAFGFPATIQGEPNNAIQWCPNQAKFPTEANQFIFFNDIHPTTHGHEVVSQYVMSNSQLFRWQLAKK